MEYKDNMVIAVSPIYNARNFNSLIDLEKVIAIELQDSEEHICLVYWRWYSAQDEYKELVKYFMGE